MPSTRIVVYLKSEDPAFSPPQHSASKALATLVLSAVNTARWTGENHHAIQLLTAETWRQVKQRVRPSLSYGKAAPPLLNAPGYHSPCFMTSYPPTPYETDGRERQAKLWKEAVKF
jgi:hypothetical protein